MKPPFSIRNFAGMRSPSTDFEAVRDDLQIPYLFDEIDLSTARSIAGNTALTKPWKGNSIYIDQQTDVGNATMIFHDPAVLSTKPGRIFVQPGFNAAIPFDQITIENAAQPGKVLRFFYGVDIDFKPGVTGQVQISGTILTQEQGSLYGSAYASQTSQLANTAEQIFAAGSNINGAVILRSHLSTNFNGAAGNNISQLVARATAPTALNQGDVLAQTKSTGGDNGVGGMYMLALEDEIQIAAGKGLFFISGVIENNSAKSALWTFK